MKISGNITRKNRISGRIERAGSGGAVNYETQVYNRPHINGEEVIGDKTIEQYGVETLTNIEVKTIFDRVFHS